MQTSLEMSSRARRLADFVIKTDQWPLSFLYRSIYDCCLAYLKWRLAKIEAVLAIYLTSSAAIDRELHGASDLDIFILIDRRSEDDIGVRELVEMTLADAIQAFPFLGPLSERINGIVYCDQSGETDRPDFLYRSKRCMFRKVYERPGFKLRRQSPAPGPFEILAELKIQTASVLKAIYRRKDTAYFWKGRLRALAVMLSDCPDLNDGLSSAKPLLDPRLMAVLRDLPDRRLYFVRSREISEPAYRLFWQLVDLALETYGLSDLPELSLPFVCSGINGPENAPIDAWDWDYARLVNLLESADFSLLKPLVLFKHLAARVEDDTVRVDSCFDAPYLFPAAVSGGSLRYKEIFLARAREAALAERVSWRQRGAAQNDIGGETKRKDGSPGSSAERFLVWAQDDRRLLGDFLRLCKACGCLEEPLRFYLSDRAVFEELRLKYPNQEEFLSLLERFYERQFAGTACDTASFLPANFFGYMISFMLAHFGGCSAPNPEELRKRLSLSLCVCTRDRPAMLSELLRSIEGQNRKPDELVIVDNGYAESAFPVAKQFEATLPIKYLKDTSSSIAALRNAAIAHSTGEIICFTDDDCILDRDWLSSVERTFLRSERIAAVGGKVCHYPEGVHGAIALFHERYLGGAQLC
jgi:hypothetical protein